MRVLDHRDIPVKGRIFFLCSSGGTEQKALCESDSIVSPVVLELQYHWKADIVVPPSWGVADDGGGRPACKLLFLTRRTHTSRYDFITCMWPEAYKVAEGEGQENRAVRLKK